MDLEKFHNLHKGKRAFLTACGPSLNNIDINLLRDELVFGVSLAYKKDGLKIDYHFIGDMNIAHQFKDEISLKAGKTLFVSYGIYISKILNHPDIYYFRGHGDKKFYKDVRQRIYGGGTSTFLAMQFAYYMGINKLYVVGLDHYKDMPESITVSRRVHGMPLVRNVEKDKAHFSDDYYSEDVYYFYPEVKKMEESYSLANKAYWESGREIYNASTETVLSENILPRINFEDIWK